MSDSSSLDRIGELLADEAVFGLATEERDKLDLLIAQQGAAVDADVYERAAAAFYLASAPVELESLPQRVRASVLQRATADQPSPTAAVAVAPAREQASAPPKVLGRVGWPLAVAASLLIGIYLGGPSDRGDDYRDLLAPGAAVTRVAWTATDDPAAAAGPTGEVVWSDARQRGYMTFRGLAANDPSAEQYQLWIFDAERDDRHPVDGGVFNIAEGDDEVVVPIDPKIAVNKAVMFAITVERPGGVVVSNRSRLPLLAKVE